MSGSWNKDTKRDMEREIMRRAHKLTVRASCGELQGPELESAILDLIWRAVEQNEKRGNVLEAAS